MKFRTDIKRNEIKTGDHKIELKNVVFKHFKDNDVLRDKLLEDIIEHINKLRSNVPDYDSGYMYVEGNNTYQVNHNIGVIPTRFICYISKKQEPKYESADIYVEDGIVLKNVTNKKVKITTPVTLKNGNTTGYLRILVWR